MMQPKRILIALLVVVLLTFCTLTVFANASAQTFEVTVSSKCDTAILAGENSYDVETGSTVEFSITAGAYSGRVDGMMLAVKFDPNYLELITDSIVAPNSYGPADYSVPGELDINYMSFQKAGGVLATVSFLVKDGAHGAATVTVEHTVYDWSTAAFQEGRDTIIADVTNAVTTLNIHDFGDEIVVDPDCSNGGRTYRPCIIVDEDGTLCPYEATLATTEKVDHNWTIEAPDCLTDKVCQYENCSLENNGFEAALGHDYSGADPDCFAAKTCVRCNFELEAALEHVPGPAADCVNDQVCARGCGYVFVEALGHAPDREAPDCVTPVLCQKEDCPVEGKVVEPALGHDESGAAADCVNDKVCARGCGEVLVAAHGHPPDREAPDCVTPVLCTNEDCPVEGKVVEAALGHDYEGPVANCTDDQICNREGCDVVLAEKLGHDYTGAAATCTTAQVCPRKYCEEVLKPALGHDESGKPADCVNDKVCVRGDCGVVLESALGHDYTGKAADCLNDQVCARGCGEVLEKATGHKPNIPAADCVTDKVCTNENCPVENKLLEKALGHDESGKAADCVTDKVCAREGCTVVLQPKLGHDASGAAATCTTDKVCAREGCTVVLLPALGHDESGKAATCTTDKVCARPDCNFVLEEKFGHDESGAEATCAAAKTCVTCGEVLVAKLTDPESHVYGEWVVETEATMSHTGSQYKVCTVCENKVTEEIPEKSSAWLIILIIVGVLALGGGGFAAYWFLIKNKKAKAEGDATTEENSEEKSEEVTEEAPATEETTEEKTEE